MVCYRPGVETRGLDFEERRKAAYHLPASLADVKDLDFKVEVSGEGKSNK